ncbi:hypothetical protein GA0061096_2380 [Fictibacillus enclensis]|nr:hypothetical protein [Fictibacillus enclensis]SCC11218.1 hypothetical protein GA0061096_2380 [Fictibacillus enclensis]
MNETDQLKALNQLLEIIHYKGNARKLSFMNRSLFHSKNIKSKNITRLRS